MSVQATTTRELELVATPPAKEAEGGGEERATLTLADAAAAGSIDAVTSLLNAHADILLADGRGHTPLHGAARAGHEAVVQLLLARGADPWARADDHTEETNAAAHMWACCAARWCRALGSWSCGPTPLAMARRGGNQEAVTRRLCRAMISGSALCGCTRGPCDPCDPCRLARLHTRCAQAIAERHQLGAAAARQRAGGDTLCCCCPMVEMFCAIGCCCVDEYFNLAAEDDHADGAPLLPRSPRRGRRVRSPGYEAPHWLRVVDDDPIMEYNRDNADNRAVHGEDESRNTSWRL